MPSPMPVCPCLPMCEQVPEQVSALESLACLALPRNRLHLDAALDPLLALPRLCELDISQNLLHNVDWASIKLPQLTVSAGRLPRARALGLLSPWHGPCWSSPHPPSPRNGDWPAPCGSGTRPLQLRRLALRQRTERSYSSAANHCWQCNCLPPAPPLQSLHLQQNPLQSLPAGLLPGS